MNHGGVHVLILLWLQVHVTACSQQPLEGEPQRDLERCYGQWLDDDSVRLTEDIRPDWSTDPSIEVCFFLDEFGQQGEVTVRGDVEVRYRPFGWLKLEGPESEDLRNVHVTEGEIWLDVRLFNAVTIEATGVLLEDDTRIDSDIERIGTMILDEFWE